MGESANGLIIFALPRQSEFWFCGDTILAMRRKGKVIAAADYDPGLLSDTFEPYLESSEDLLWMESLKDPRVYRTLFNHFARFNDNEPQRCIVMSAKLDEVKTAHAIGAHALWLRDNRDLLESSFYYRGENALGPLKSPLDHIEEIMATWPPARAEIKTAVAHAKDPRPFVVN